MRAARYPYLPDPGSAEQPQPDAPSASASAVLPAQLTYTSFDDGVSGGGWQVKETEGELTAAEADELRGRVATHFDAGVDLPRFPTPDEQASFPRRLVYAPMITGGDDHRDGIGGDRVAWWHTAPAGVDASGRPGNVFAHVVADRAAAEPVLRPIDRWRSPGWLTPYGPEQVAAARLGPPPGPGAITGPDHLIDFCFGNFDRIAVLGPLLDAVDAALAGGPRIVLGVADCDRAARWIAAVTHLTDARTAARIYFSTLERAGGLAEIFDQQGVLLACVPESDLDDIDDQLRRIVHPTVVITENEFPELGDLPAAGSSGHPHITAHGDRISVTQWSVMARVLLEATEPESVRTVLDQLNPIAREVGAVSYGVDWPLALAIASGSGQFAEANAEAAQVIVARSPDGLSQHPELYQAAVDLIQTQCGRSTADAWQQVAALFTGTGEFTGTSDDSRSTTAPVSLLARLAVETYLERALTDPDWLTRNAAVPIPDPLPPVQAPKLSADLDQQLRGLIEAGSADPVHIARLADLVGRIGLLTDPVVDKLRHLVQRDLAPRLSGPDASTMIRTIGPVSPDTLEQVIRPEVLPEAPAPAELGTRLSSELARWLYPAPPLPVPLRDLRDLERADRRLGDYWLRAELAWWLISTGQIDAPAERSQQPYAGWTLLHAERLANQRRDTTVWQFAEWERVKPLVDRHWPTDDLLILLEEFPLGRQDGLRLWEPLLWSARWVELTDVIAGIEADRSGVAPHLLELVDVRSVIARPGDWLPTPGWYQTSAKIINLVAGRVPDRATAADLADDLRLGMITALFLRLLVEPERGTGLTQVLDAFGPSALGADQSSHLYRWLQVALTASQRRLRDGLLTDVKPLTDATIAAAAVRARDDFPGGSSSAPAAAWMARFTLTPGGAGVLDLLVAARLKDRSERDRSRQLRRDTVELLRQRTGVEHGREIDRAVGQQLKRWRELGSAAS